MFGEDVGRLYAVNKEGLLALVNVAKLAKSLGVAPDFGTHALCEKVALLKEADEVPVHNLEITLLSKFKKNGEETFTRDKVVESLFFDSEAADAFSVEMAPLSSRMLRVAAFETSSLRDGSGDMKAAASFYDQIVAILSYSSGGGAPALEKRTSYLQMIPNGIPIDLKAFTDHPPVSPRNPQGDQRTTEEFSDYASLSFGPSGKAADWDVEKRFGFIINSVNSSKQPDPNALKILERIRNYLWVKVRDPFTGEETEEKSPAWQAYIAANRKFTVALSTFIARKGQQDLSTPEGQRAWQAEALILNMKIDEARDELQSHTNTRKALDYLRVHGNNAVATAISGAKDRYNNSAIPSLFNEGEKFHPSYGVPSNWYADDSGYSQVDMTNKNVSSTYSHEASSYGGGASFSLGLFSIGGSHQRSREETRAHMETAEFGISFKLATIPIQRKWMDTTLFTLDSWELGGQPKGKISSGRFPADDSDLNRRTLPFYSTALVIAKDVKIKGNWTEADLKILKESTRSGGSIGWGPFRLGGSYGRSSEKREFHSHESDGTFSIPGAQVIAVINKVVPFAAPDGA